MDSTLPKCCCNYIHVKCIATSVQYPTLKHNFPAIQLENHKTWLVVGTQFWQYSTENHKMKDCLNKDGGKKPKKSQLKLESFWRLVAHSWRRTVVSSLLFLRWNIADSLTGKLGKNGLISMQPHITPLQGFLSTQNVRHLCKEKSAINTAIGGTLLEASTTMKGATLFKKISTCRDDFWPGSAQLCNPW